MFGADGGVQRKLRWGAWGLAVILAATAVSSDPADARARRKRHSARHHTAAVERYQPSSATIVVDVNSGAVLQASNADSPRHPASLTKIMTLYLLFERLEAGKLKSSSQLRVSAHAAAQAPSKLGLKPGETIAVEDAIKAIVTKSANDVAVVLAEALAGDEDEFARMMTRKAQAIGMKHTTYRNASGLPDDQQITTARDQTLLARAIRERFPQFYQYFSTVSFQYRGHAMRNHNKLLGRVAGVDGIKTGYTHDSGFNLVTSVRRGNRYIVAVVFGGRTAAARDARMRDLIEEYIDIAANKRTAAPMLAASPETTEPSKLRVAAGGPLVPPRMEAAHFVSPAAGSTDPIKPKLVKTVVVKAGAMLALLPAPVPQPVAVQATASVTPANLDIAKTAPVPPPVAKSGVLGVLPVRIASAGDAAVPAVGKPGGGWIIQVGAFDDEREAKERLSTALGQAKELLGEAGPFTEKVMKGDKALYRARFSGLGKEQAEDACRQLKRGEIPCMLLKN